MNREQQWEIVRTLLQRNDLNSQATEAFRQAYPTTPEKMLRTRVFHTYIDGISKPVSNGFKPDETDKRRISLATDSNQMKRINVKFPGATIRFIR